MSDTAAQLAALRALLAKTDDVVQRSVLNTLIAQLENSQQPLVNLAQSQTGDVSIDTLAGRDITNIAQQNHFIISGDATGQLARIIQRAGRSRIYSNLGAPPYTTFIMRRQVYDAVIDALRQRAAIVLIHGLGGNGKTSLAHEIASKCLGQLPGIPPFEGIIWVSDQHAPGSTTLQTVLDEIARAVDYPGATSLEPEQKRLDIEDILRAMRVLLVVDGLETVKDNLLIHWLQRLPAPSRALITSRERHRELQSVWSVELRGMSVDEAHSLLVQRLNALELGEYAHDLTPFDPVLELTGCSPKAIEIVLGHLKYGGRGLSQVINDLQRGRDSELFDHVFARSWSLLEEGARHVLMAASIFPASVSDEALEAVAGVESYPFADAMRKLFNMGLLESRRITLDAPSRHSLHALVRTFAEARCSEQPQWTSAARDRWLTWASEFAARAEWPVHDLRRLDLLDQEDDEAIVFAALRWADTEGRAEAVVRLAQGVDHYYYVRGVWDKKVFVDQRRISAAQSLGNRLEEARSIAQYVQVLCTRGMVVDLQEAANWLGPLDTLLQEPALQATDLETASVVVQILHAFAFYHLAQREYEQARLFLERSRTITPEPKANLATATLRWLGITLYNQGLLEDAKATFEKALNLAEAANDKRGQVNCRIGLAKIHNDQNQFAAATLFVEEALTRARENKDRRYIAQAQLEQARLAVAQGDVATAQAALQDAVELAGRLSLTADSDRLRDTELRLRALLTAGEPEV